VNIAVGTALLMTGPGRYSLDRLFGIKIPRWVTALLTLGASVTITVGLLMEPEPPAADELA
jgi:hypothetical protein